MMPDSRFNGRPLAAVWITEEASAALGLPNTRLNLSDPMAAEMYFMMGQLQLVGVAGGRRFISSRFIVAWVFDDIGDSA